MYQLTAYRLSDNSASLFPLDVNREWMDNTYDKHAYRCFPVSLANKLGWGISFPEDISFIWDGISDSTSQHVRILSGHKYVHSDRANATISFKTGLMFRSSDDISLLHMPVPNQFIDGAQPFTTLISSSFFHGEFPCAWMITRPNEVITIRANTPIISIVPINLMNIQNSSIRFNDMSQMPKYPYTKDYPEKIAELSRTGEWGDFYRKGVNDVGDKIGDHQVKTIKLNVEM